MKPLIPTPAQMAHIGKVTQFWLPINPQPEGTKPFACPYNPGDLIPIKQAWCPVTLGNTPMFFYSAGMSAAEKKGYKFRSASTMPAHAVRYHFKVLERVARRVQTMTEEEAVLCGFMHDECPTSERECALEYCQYDLDIQCPECQKRWGFKKVWQKQHGKKPGLAWGDNPYAWQLIGEVVK